MLSGCDCVMKLWHNKNKEINKQQQKSRSFQELLGNDQYLGGRVLSRIYRLGEKSQVAEGYELPRRGPGGFPWKFFEMNKR